MNPVNSKRSFLSWLILSLLTFGLHAVEPAPKTLRVLFIGNSLTQYNNLPAMIAGMATASGRELNFAGNLVGGATLEKHWKDGKALQRIQEGHWDYVVLQDLSKQAYSDRDSMVRHARLFDAEIRKAGARTMFYMTWALEDSQSNFAAIEEAYTSLAKELHGVVVPAGAAWHAVTSGTEHPASQLYIADHKHPTPAGTYLAACVFYRVLFEAPSTGLPERIELKKAVLANLSKEEAAALQKVADATVLPKIE